MSYRILKSELNSPSKFKERFAEYISNLQKDIFEKNVIEFNSDELGELLLSACRSDDYDIVEIQEKKMLLNKDRVGNWIQGKLIPNTIVLSLDDEDIIRLLLFCIEITYQMFSGGTRATRMQKGFRQRSRTFETILADQFVGKLGEVMLKRFIETNFSTKIELDWEISTDIEKYRNDIMNAEKNISIKSSPSLSGIWAEADIGYDYGITVKCSVPQPTILQFFIEVCGFTRLLDFADDKIPSQDMLFKGYLGCMRQRIKDYKCGEIQTHLKGYICGYFDTSNYSPTKEGEDLAYLGVVREERYLVPINELKYARNEWNEFINNAIRKP